MRTTIFTGRLPRDHGIKSFATYRLLGSKTRYELLPKGAFVSLLERCGLVATEPVTSAARRRRPPIADMLNDIGISTGLVRIWGTHPPERVSGFMLSPYFHLLADGPRAQEALVPPDLLGEARARLVRARDIDPSLLAEFVEPATGGDAQGRRRRELLARALAPDLTYRRAGEMLRAAYDPRFFATSFHGLDLVGHSFLRFARPERFGDVRGPDARRYGRALGRYTALVGQWIGEAVQGLRPDEVLLVVSAYGMEPVPLWRRLLGDLGGGGETSGTHAAAPDGFLLAVGDGIRPGAKIEGASVLDLAPTILYLSGLPVARDMEGRVLTEILEDDYARAHPVTFIPSYESLAVAPPVGPAAGPLPTLSEEPIP